jgi:serine/threonine protein kinase/CHASE2 domain-containing sensor protein
VAARSPSIEDIAGDILDGVSIDWSLAESSAVSADHELLSQLRVVASVAELLRRPPGSTADVRVLPTEPPRSVQDVPAIVGGKYQIEASVGHGGMGSVYRARHIELGKTFALKLLLPHRSFRADSLARFRVEAQALGRLNHPNIVQVTDFGVDPDVGPYLVMEYIEGMTLGEIVKARRMLSLDEAIPIFAGISDALDHAHAAGILHRDLKPANVLLVTRTDGQRDAKIVDFGIASILDSPPSPRPIPESGESIESVVLSAGDAADSAVRRDPDGVGRQSTRLTVPGAVVGTLEYIAPEVIDGKRASAAADIFGLGVLIYEVLVGRRPFESLPGEPLNAHVKRYLPIPSDVCAAIPRELDAAILRPLNLDPSLRPLSARAVVAALVDGLHHARVRQWRRAELPRRAGLAVVVAILALWLHGRIRQVPIVQTVENAFVDLRVAFQSPRPPDPRIVLISIDEATLASDSSPLADKADEVGTMLRQVFEAGARAVAIDLLLPERWSESEPFSRLILDHSPRIVLASYSGPEGHVRGPESVRGLTTMALGPPAIEKLFAFVNVSADSDGVVRAIPLSYGNERGQRVQSLVARTAEISGVGRRGEPTANDRLWIDYSIDWTAFKRVSWKGIPHVLSNQPGAFRDRVILVGGEFAGSGDVYSLSPYGRSSANEVSGLVLQALALNTLLAGMDIRVSDGTMVVILLWVLTSIGAMAVLSSAHSVRTIGILVVGCCVYIGCSFFLFRWRHHLSPVAAPMLTFVLVSVLALAVRARLPRHPAKLITPEVTI